MAKVDLKGVKERLEELEKVLGVVKGLGEVVENVSRDRSIYAISKNRQVGNSGTVLNGGGTSQLSF